MPIERCRQATATPTRRSAKTPSPDASVGYSSPPTRPPALAASPIPTALFPLNCSIGSDVTTRDIDATRQTLISAAQRRIDDALAAWLAGDFDRAASSAPTACELLGKAALWSKHPTLLVSLEDNHEATLVALATAPTLASPKTRTIGLKQVLSRLVLIYGDLPVPPKRCTRPQPT